MFKATLNVTVLGENAAQFSPKKIWAVQINFEFDGARGKCCPIFSKMFRGLQFNFNAGGKCCPFFSKMFGSSVQLLKFDVTRGSAAQFSPRKFWEFNSTLHFTVEGKMLPSYLQLNLGSSIEFLNLMVQGENAAQSSPISFWGFSSTLDAGGKCCTFSSRTFWGSAQLLKLMLQMPIFLQNRGSVQLLKLVVVGEDAAHFSPQMFRVQFNFDLDVTRESAANSCHNILGLSSTLGF